MDDVVEAIKKLCICIPVIGGIMIGVVLLHENGCSCDSKQGVTFSSPQDVTQKFVNAMGELNFDKMREYTKDDATVFVGNLEVQYSKLNSSEKEQFKALVKKAATTAKIKVSKYNKTEDRVVYADLTNAEDSKAKTTLKLERKDSLSPWYITNIFDN